MVQLHTVVPTLRRCESAEVWSLLTGQNPIHNWNSSSLLLLYSGGSKTGSVLLTVHSQVTVTGTITHADEPHPDTCDPLQHPNPNAIRCPDSSCALFVGTTPFFPCSPPRIRVQPPLLPAARPDRGCGQLPAASPSLTPPPPAPCSRDPSFNHHHPGNDAASSLPATRPNPATAQIVQHGTGSLLRLGSE